MIASVILAAGASSRMRGRDKLCEEVSGTPLLRLQVMRARATGTQVYVALPKDATARADLIDGLGATIIWIDHADEGMGASLRQAVFGLPMVAAFMVMLADLVALRTDDLNRVIAARQAHPDAKIWRGATIDGKPGHPVLFDACLRPLFAKLTGDDGAQSMIAQYAADTCLVPLPGERARLDLDTPEDWTAYRKSTC